MADQKPINTLKKQNKQVPADHHIIGLVGQSPLALAFLVAVLGISVWIFSQIQITNTEQAVFGLLSLGTQLNPGATAAQVREFMSGSLDYYNGIAAVIGWGVQLALLLVAFPPDSALLTLRRRFVSDPTPSLANSAMSQHRWREFLTCVLIGGDVVTDFLYVFRGHTLWPLSGPLFGVVIVGLLYPVAICFVTVFCFKYLMVFLEALIGQFFSRSEAA